MAVIDADAHVVEWERTWEYMDEGESAFAPRVMVFKEPAQKPSGQRAGEYWKIGNRVFAKDGNIGFDIARERREAADIDALSPIWMSSGWTFRSFTRAYFSGR